MLPSLLGAPSLADEDIDTESQTTLTVFVTNGTANGTTIVGNDVIVTIYEQEKPIQTLKKKVDADGKAIFENVPAANNIAALPRVKHQNIEFSGRAVALKSDQTAFDARVEVFDVSTDRSKLSVTTHHFIIKPHVDSLQIIEYMQLKNSSDMALTSEQKDSDGRSIVLEVMLPEGFKKLACSNYFQDGALVITEHGFYDTMAIPPGQYDAVFSYLLKINSEIIGITKKISLPTSEFMVFSQLSKERINGLGDASGQITLADGGSGEYFSSQALKVGDQITFRIIGFNVNNSDSSVWITFSVVFALIALLVILRLSSRMR